jgi:hypothetical protein
MLWGIDARHRTVVWSSSDELQIELSRSRRYGHRFVLIRIPYVFRAEARSNGNEEVALAISLLVRRVDRVWSDGANVYLLLPECDGAMADAMLDRIRERLAKLISEEVRLAISSAVFPDDGFTKRALFGALERRSIRPVNQTGHVVPAPPTPKAPAA